ncbi:MAG TPA: ubiquinone biosynthesis protein COQ7 [Dehalococcoidia bacterium]|nr:ubiquinone biosynthesis protein COQ7 [Dehalococcoidia bacterium]
MDFSNPFGTMVTRKMTAEELARAIRQNIAAELDAVALYQAHFDATDDERAKKVLAHARDDEKEHVGEFLALLEILDPQQAEYIKKGKAEIAELLEGK